jgi:hypothetical protein
LFYKTDVGRALRADSCLPLRGIDHFIDFVVAGATHERARDLCGLYLAHHGSHLEENHFVVRAIEIKPATQSYLFVEDWLTDKATASRNDTGAHRAYGVAALVLDRLHILMRRKDNSQGFNLLVGDLLLPHRERDGEAAPVRTITGQMLGMTREGFHFTRAALLKRVADEGATLESLQADYTGIKRFRDWPKETQANFLELRDRLPKQRFPDPILHPDAMKAP